MIPFSGVLLILVGVICGLYARQNSTASFFHKVLLWYGLLAIGFSLFAGYFLLNTYQSLTTFVANNALLVLMLLSSIVRPDNMDEFCRQQLILALRLVVLWRLLIGRADELVLRKLSLHAH
uniref:NADH dehydrogenase subunit 4L n=1 Tax=Ditylenchus dipsaci TaxID=166011 RepID=A0A915E1H6_9BILA